MISLQTGQAKQLIAVLDLFYISWNASEYSGSSIYGHNM